MRTQKNGCAFYFTRRERKVMNIQEITQCCANNETEKLNINDMNTGLLYVKESILHDTYYENDKTKEKFATVTDILLSILKEMSNRTSYACNLLDAYCSHDLSQSGQELFWSTPNGELPDIYTNTGTVKIRIKGRNVWLKIINSMLEIIESNLHTVPRIIPSIDTRILYNSKTNTKYGKQSKTLNKCAIIKQDIDESLHNAFDKYKRWHYMYGTESIIYVPIPESIDTIPSEKEIFQSCAKTFSENIAREMTKNEIEVYIPLKRVILEQNIHHKNDLNI